MDSNRTQKILLLIIVLVALALACNGNGTETPPPEPEPECPYEDPANICSEWLEQSCKASVSAIKNDVDMEISSNLYDLSVGLEYLVAEGAHLFLSGQGEADVDYGGGHKMTYFAPEEGTTDVRFSVWNGSRNVVISAGSGQIVEDEDIPGCKTTVIANTQKGEIKIVGDGTEFFVSVVDNNEVQVAVTEGEVAVTDALDNTVILSPQLVQAVAVAVVVTNGQSGEVLKLSDDSIQLLENMRTGRDILGRPITIFNSPGFDPAILYPKAYPEGGYLEKARDGAYTGTTVVVEGSFTDVDEVKFEKSMEEFEAATGITVNYNGNKEFEASIAIRVQAGDPPDIADFPQPGLLANFVRQGYIVDPTTFIDESWLKEQYNQSWLDMSRMEGQSAGVWHRFNAKSLVWYPKDDFDAAGYAIPTTWDELITLMDMIVADGDSPWCIGIESGAATGWPATDWMEDFMLRTTSLENYDKWTTGDLPFASPEVISAADTLAEIWFNDEYVYGGTDGIVNTFFGDSPTPMFEDPPRCWLHKQGNFITSFFPEGAEAGIDYDFFYLPPIDPAYGKPFLVAGDIMAMFNDRPEVRALMEWFTSPYSVMGWLETGGALAAHQTVILDMYDVDLERGIAALVSEATSFRFDASDLMPGEVGAGSFWKGMTDWVSGAADLETVLFEIDESWPK